MAKETTKHPIFRQFDLNDVVEIMLTDADGEEIAVAPGHRSEQELKLLAQQNGVRGPVNLIARLSNGLTNGPVQISVPAPRVPAASLFKSSRLANVEPAARRDPREARNLRDEEREEEPDDDFGADLEPRRRSAGGAAPALAPRRRPMQPKQRRPCGRSGMTAAWTTH